MLLSDFLTLVRIIRSLYGSKAARTFFEENKDKFSTLSDVDVEKLKSYLHL